MDLRQSALNLAKNPLGIIGLFVLFVEAVLLVGVGTTTGGIQVSLTIFVIGFPILIGIGFFLILWHKPYVLYAPQEFPKQTGVGEFVSAMQQNPTKIGSESVADKELVKPDLILSLGPKDASEGETLEETKIIEGEGNEEAPEGTTFYEEVEKGNFEEAYALAKQIVLMHETHEKQIYWEAFYLYHLFQKGWSNGFPKLKLLLEENPEVDVALTWLAFVYEKMQMWEEAGECYKRYKNEAKGLSEKAKRKLMYGEFLFARGRLEPALQEIREGISETSDHLQLSDFYFLMGKILLKLQKDDPHLGLACFQKALALRPTDASFRFGVAHENSEKLGPEMTFHNYRKCIELNPSEYALNNAGVSAGELDLKITSVGYYKEAEKKGNTLAMANLAYQLLDAGFMEEAKDLLEKARLNPDKHENVDRGLGDISRRWENEKSKIEELGKKVDKIIIWRIREAEAISQEKFNAEDLVGTYEYDGSKEVIISTEKELVNIKVVLPLGTFNLIGRVEGKLVRYDWERRSTSPLATALLTHRPPFNFDTSEKGKGTFIIENGGKILNGYRVTLTAPLDLTEWKIKRVS